MGKFFILFLTLFISSYCYGTSKTFMPDNDLDKQDGFFDNGMTEDAFNEIIDSVEKFYTPIVKQLGATLIINRKWDDSTVNAQAYQSGDYWYVDMFGGLARRPEITYDGFAMVLCHEIGHHIGGFPFVEDWAANEGQSDYFALHGCAKTIWTNETKEETVIDAYAKQLCDNYSNDAKLCYREMNAGYSLANLLGSLNKGKQVSFQTPDKTIVRKTNNAHPNAQCRLDTYVASTLCNKPWDNKVIPQTESESSKSLCINTNVNGGYDIQARPRCWFKPT